MNKQGNKNNPRGGVEWRDIRGYEGSYQVSSDGQVRRVVGVITRSDGTSLPMKEHVLKPRLKNSGYLFVSLRLPGKKGNAYVHHLVAAAFIGERPQKHDINHRDGNKENNRVENLEYMTRAENMRHARNAGLYRNFADGHYGAKLTSEAVRMIRWAHSTCGIRGDELAPHFGVSARTVNDVIDNLTWRSVNE